MSKTVLMLCSQPTLSSPGKPAKFSRVARCAAGMLVFVSAALVSCKTKPALDTPHYDPNSAPRVQAPTDPKNIPIRPGETLDVYVLEDATLNGGYTVRAEGHIIFPTMGRIQLAGLTPTQAEARMKELLESQKLRVATVILDRTSMVGSNQANATTQQMLVYITGKVARPGQHNLTVEIGKTMGVYEAILISGGFARFSNEAKAYVLRQAAPSQPKQKMPLDLKAVAEGKASDIPIRTGDIVVVPEKVFGF
ncbi:polysaccharide biosynthesis/export family protein [Verrucomicrobium sp. BvORR106]|uniref:polysaccharide biosynthesis/export family protein n=1 Tax=Verrucomicrobium sp. BvORR106 TaxID=1403819 RepID=UPI0009DF1070|nr:polysaccharide biosynthesis/export family protein [Verrucomicrobium sp. BvORR106]